MRYHNTIQGTFIERTNRFIALVKIDDQVCVCHVKNTGRCKELLIRGVQVILERSQNPARKTKYDLIAVYKGERLINIDSQAPNKVFHEWVCDGNLFGKADLIRPECTYLRSRFDFYIEADGKQIFVEVKGVTLENDGIVLFPDAPTERGVKHLKELIDAKNSGYEAYICFIIQMEKCKYFSPNAATHKEFADTLKKATDNGVKILAFNCNVEHDSLTVLDSVNVVI